MPTSRAGSNGTRRRGERGFTIVELMVVITIVGLAAATVVLTLPDPRGRLNDEAARFAARVRAAHDLAIIDGRSVSVWVTAGGYGFDVHAREGWTPIADKPFRVERWSAGVAPSIASPDGRERVIFDSTGLANRALRLDLGRDAERARVVIGNDGSVAIDG